MQKLTRTIPKLFRSHKPVLPFSKPFLNPFSTYVSSYKGRPGSPLQLCQMNLEQFKTCTEWASKEGWFIYEGDAETFFESDPSGFFGGTINGELVCCYTGFKYDDYFFLSLHIVKDEFQNMGYGTDVDKYAADFWKDAKSVSFDVVGKRILRYQKLGFHEYSTGKVIQKVAEGKLDKDLVDLKTVSIDELLKYDLSVFGYNRSPYIRALAKQKAYKGLASLDKDGKVQGYALLRKLKYQPGYGISPLIADNKEIACKLLAGLQSYCVGEEVTISIFDINPVGVQIFEEQGWRVWGEFMRMYGGQKPKIDMMRLIVCDTY